MNQVVLNKKVSIERCVVQARKYYAMKGELPFEEDHLRQDAVALHVQRACELCIDIANHLIKTRKLGLGNRFFRRDFFASDKVYHAAILE